VVFSTIDRMRLLTGLTWRFIKTVKHSACPASVSLIRVLSSNFVSGEVIAITVIPNSTRDNRPTFCLMERSELLPTRAIRFCSASK